MPLRTGAKHPVVLSLPGRSLQRWHLALMQALRMRGHPVGIDMADVAIAGVPGLDLVRSLDKILYNARLCDKTDMAGGVGAHEFEGQDPIENPAVVLDCTGSSALGGCPVLQPFFDGSTDAHGLIEALIDNRPPRIGWQRKSDGNLIHSGTAAIAASHILSQSFSETLARLASMAPTAILNAGNVGAVPSAKSDIVSGSSALLAHSASTIAGRLLKRLTRSLKKGRQWNIGWRHVAEGRGLVATGHFSPGAYRWLPRTTASYVADPFPFSHGGRTWLFCEEFPFATGKGIISVAECADDGTPGPMRPVLETGCHLSYPAVFAQGDTVFMIPETTGNRTLELYRADPFPDRWVLHAVLANDVYWGDATLFSHEGRLWLAATTMDAGATDRDSLSLFYSDRLGGDWTPHARNPVLVDASGARPAGWIEQCADGLHRPGQDCSGGYGWGLSVSRIDRLDTEHYAETRIAQFPPPASLAATGFHTVNRAGTFEVIDAIL